MTDDPDDSNDPNSKQVSDETLSDLLRGRPAAGVDPVTLKKITMVREAVRRSVDRELKNVAPDQLARVRDQITKRIGATANSPPSLSVIKSRSRFPQWGFAMAAGVTGIAVGILVQSQTGVLPGTGANDELVISVGQIDRGAKSYKTVVVGVRDPVVATSIMTQALILDHVPFKAFHNAKTGQQRLLFDIPSVESTNLEKVLKQFNASIPPEGGVELIFDRK